MGPSNPPTDGLPEPVPTLDGARAVLEVGGANPPCPLEAGMHDGASGRARGETLPVYNPVDLTFVESARELPDPPVIESTGPVRFSQFTPHRVRIRQYRTGDRCGPRPATEERGG